jgi:hypothetical protein
MPNRIPAACLLLALPILASACRKKEEPQAPPLPAPAAEAGPPIDSLAPGELVEGTEKAFALVLPRGMHVDSNFMSAVYASGGLKADHVANYVRARVRGGTGTRGAVGTVFDNVAVPSEPSRLLHILVAHSPAGDGCRIEVRDITPAPPLPLPPTTAERYRAAGLTPDGKFIDPMHRQ